MGTRGGDRAQLTQDTQKSVIMAQFNLALSLLFD